MSAPDDTVPRIRGTAGNDGPRGLRKARRGHTLVETLVVCCLLLLLLGGIYQIVSFGMRYYQGARAQEDAHQEALVAIRRLTVDLAESTLGGVSWPTSSSVVLASPTPLSTRPGGWDYQDGELMWHKWVGYYLQDGDLVRAEIRIQPAVTELDDPPNLSKFKNQADYSRVVARHIDTLAVGPGLNPDLVEVAVRAHVSGAGGRITEIPMRTQVKPEQ